MHKSIPRFANVRSSIVEGVYKNWKMICSLNFVSIHVSLYWFVWQQADLSVHGAPEFDQTKVKWKQIKIPLLAQYMHPCIVCFEHTPEKNAKVDAELRYIQEEN